jgi:hypothetical protein
MQGQHAYWAIFLLAAPGLQAHGVNASGSLNAADTIASNSLTGQQCRGIRKQLDSLQSQLRHGTTAKRGRKLRTQMRKLELRRFRGCRDA